MADRIDHAARALIEYDAAQDVMESEGITDGTVVASAVLAQVHATLALVEQQRIANVIAWTVGAAYSPSQGVIAEVTAALRLPEEPGPF